MHNLWVGTLALRTPRDDHRRRSRDHRATRSSSRDACDRPAIQKSAHSPRGLLSQTTSPPFYLSCRSAIQTRSSRSPQRSVGAGIPGSSFSREAWRARGEGGGGWGGGGETTPFLRRYPAAGGSTRATSSCPSARSARAARDGRTSVLRSTRNAGYASITESWLWGRAARGRSARGRWFSSCTGSRPRPGRWPSSGRGNTRG